ncbi:rod shape-determining protein MreD [Funiculus sociatus GB2-A5]|jgi:rod shape-determining protein MreD|uniref:Rod shape-determining protein MreD n=1 Tax=Funiculus sociatus GB2-A5 TaxID=2933946 RepID=A0ABV0JRK0_9CYAN|nr:MULTISPECIES: rod shape-determining protein MreD [unclassified Trichocoleus]MBD1904991.1 rod shape-determining protein MreD [Trichocoleus sp. FACHB-832]MBD1931322.1 rod shape-determining protein MreD [Trichocoleus sp. FACHB-69]MBD2064061.1 rod shape-determining protein MreD [Trichocoleus sp. FACHB-6]
MIKVSNLSPWARQIVNWAVTVGSVVLCLLILPTRLPGMELLGIAPNWLLIWVVAWSVKRTAVQGAVAGLVLGLIQDGMTSPEPSHALSLAVVGILTARIQKQRYIEEDFISVALIVFAMAVVAETVSAIQFSIGSDRTLAAIWTYHQRIALSSAILSSLWAPVVYYPLNRWWQQMNLLQQS